MKEAQKTQDKLIENQYNRWVMANQQYNKLKDLILNEEEDSK